MTGEVRPQGERDGVKAAIRRHEVRIFSPDGKWWWSCACGSLSGGWSRRDIALDEAEAHLTKGEVDE
jgi:hypothetical protein